MRLMLLRHAKAEKGGPGTSDRDRPLNPRGYKDAPRIGAYMAHHALRPDRAVVSDARRTRETWEGVASALPQAPAATFEDALYNADPETIVELARESPNATPCVLMVGHNPGLHYAARLLIAAGDVACACDRSSSQPARTVGCRGSRAAHLCEIICPMPEACRRVCQCWN